MAGHGYRRLTCVGTWEGEHERHAGPPCPEQLDGRISMAPVPVLVVYWSVRLHLSMDRGLGVEEVAMQKVS